MVSNLNFLARDFAKILFFFNTDVPQFCHKTLTSEIYLIIALIYCGKLEGNSSMLISF